MKAKLLRVSILLPIPFLFLFWVNFHIDEDYFSVPTQMAEMIVNRERLGIPRKYIDYNERVFQKAVVEKQNRASDVVVFGSSRARYIKASLFPDHSFHNYAVNAATLEDSIALYGLLKKNGLSPKHIILSLDYWVLMKDSGYTNWQTWASDYKLAADMMGIDTSNVPAGAEKVWNFRRFLEVFSPSYFQHNLKLVWESGFNKESDRNFKTTEVESYEVYVINEDGSFGDQKIAASVDEVRKIVQTIDPGSPSLKDIDPGMETMLRKFLDALQKDKVEVTFLILPLHPYTYAQWIKDDSHGLQKAEDYFQAIAKERSLRIIGSFDPDKTGAKEEEFRDWLHPRRPLVARLLQQGMVQR